MPQPIRYLLRRILRIKPPRDIFPFLSLLILSFTLQILDNISQRSWTELECDVKGFRVRFLPVIVIPDDVGVVIGLLEDGYFVSGQGYKILQETFDGDCSALK